jgi:hypothetical protein
MIKNIEINNNVYEKASDYPEFFIKGFQLNRCYLSDWDDIKKIFESHKVKLNTHGPILTINELQFAKVADQLTNKLKTDKEIIRCINVGITNKTDIEKTIFTVLLRVFPEYCYQNSVESFKKWVGSKESNKNIQKLFSLNGTIKETKNDIKRIVEDILK